MKPAAASPVGKVVSAAEQVASACRAAARLIAAGISELRPAASAVAPRAGHRPAEPGPPAHRVEAGGGAAAITPAPTAQGATPTPPPATSALTGGAEGLGVTVAGGMILLVLTALVALELVGGRSAPHRWRSALESARAVGQDLRERGEVRPVVVLVVVSLGLWGLVILWILTR